jgi:hypothetical protein
MAPEEVTLDDSWLDHHVPCDTKMPAINDSGEVTHDETCGKPAIVRTLIVCPKGWQRWRFHCESCYQTLRDGQMGCLCCGQPITPLKSSWL